MSWSVVVNVGDIVEDKYEVLRLLGEGGMGTVYEARHLKLGRRVALKFLRVELAKNPEAASRFMREARAAASIGSEHIVDVMDVSQTADGSPYLVMEFLEGDDLSKLISNQGPFAPDRAARLTIQLCHALALAHGQGIIHRDIKPENMMIERRLDGSERLKVLDFGLAKFRQSAEGQTANLTATGATMGTPYYMAPEQALGEKSLDHRVDIYSTGVVLFQMLTKALPFDGETYAEILVKAATKEPVRPREVRPELSQALESIVMRAIARDRNQRIESAEALACELAPFANGAAPYQTSMGSAPTQLPATMPGEISAQASQWVASQSTQGPTASSQGQMIPNGPRPGPQTYVLGGGMAPSDPSQGVPQVSLDTPSPFDRKVPQFAAQTPPGSVQGMASMNGQLGYGMPTGLSQSVPPVAVTPTESSRALKIIGLVAIVLIVAGATSIGVWLYLSRNRSEETVASQSPLPASPPQMDLQQPPSAVNPANAIGVPMPIVPTSIPDGGAALDAALEREESGASPSTRDKAPRRSREEPPEEPEPEPAAPPPSQNLPFPQVPAQGQREPTQPSLPFPTAPTPQPRPQPQPGQVLQPQTQPQPQPQPAPAVSSGSAFATGRAQAQAGDFNGCVRSLANAGNSPQVMALRIRCYQGAGNTAQACAQAAQCQSNRFCQRFMRRNCR